MEKTEARDESKCWGGKISREMCLKGKYIQRKCDSWENEDGTITVPEVLIEYMNGLTLIS